ncbi:MAG: C25 family cysteine peptidase [Blastocatellia bacterium]
MKRSSLWALIVIAAFLLTASVAAQSELFAGRSAQSPQSRNVPWPTLEQQLEADDVMPGSELEKLVRANQNFDMLRPEEARDRLPYPLWLRVYWRKQHPEATYSASDPSGGYPRTLNAIYSNLKATLNVAAKTEAAQSASTFQWPSLSQQLIDAGVAPGSALEALIRANQDFSMLRPEEAKDTLRVPLWLRVHWRKAHPEGNYSALDPTGGYPLVLKEVYEWMLSHQDLQPGKPEPFAVPSSSPDATVSQEARASGAQSASRSESDVRINFLNPQQVIIGSNNIGGSGLQAQYFSSDGGATWGQSTLSLTTGDSFHSDPAVDWTSDGRGWSATLGINSGGSVLKGRMYVSTNAGATWTFDNTFTASQTNVDKEMIWIDHSAVSPFKDNIYVIWHGGNPVYVNRRTSAGWQTPLQVSAGETTGTGIGGDIKTNRDGDVFGFWPDTTSRGLYVVKSTNGGVSFATPVRIATSFDGYDIGVPSFNSRRALIYVSGGAYKSPSKNMVYATWTDLTGAAGCASSANEPGSNAASTCKTRIWFARSTDGGVTWGTAAMINNQAGLNDQFNQWLAVDETTGAIGVIYYDTVNDAGRKKTDIYYQSSFNDGVSWNTPVKITSAQTDETIAGADSGNQYGDYNALSGYAGVFFPSWTDRRNNAKEEIWTARVADAICTAPGSPIIGTATASAPNQIQVSWTAGAPAAASYNVYRAVGTCAAPGTFTRVASGVAGTSYLDPTVSGGTTYAYKIEAADATGNCVSSLSGCASATATGVCTLVPTFTGLSSVTNAALATCQLNLSWTAATANCAGPITYNVYRSTTTGFTPSVGNLIAQNVTGTTYNDNSPLNNGTTYYYIVRAIDSSNLKQDTNTVEKSATPTGVISFSTLTETFEGSQSGGGFDNSGWTKSAVSGAVNWVWSTSQSQTPTHSWFSASQTTVSDRALVSPSFVVSASTTLSFWHTFSFETGSGNFYDGGTLEYTTNAGSTWTVLPDAVFTAGLFNATISTGFSNPIGGKRAWGGGTIGAMTQVTANLASLAGNTVQLRWHEGDDSSTANTGWFVDSVTITNAGTPSACTPAPPTSVDLLSFNATAYSGGTLLEWKTGREVNNLGFRVYRDEGGQRVLVTPQVIAGSALLTGVGTMLDAGRSYSWWDAANKGAAQYWIEDLDLNGKSVLRGPFAAKLTGGVSLRQSNAALLAQVGNAQYGLTEWADTTTRPVAERMQIQAVSAAKPGVKLTVRKSGFYRVTQADLAAAGVSLAGEPRLLQMTVDGQEMPINVMTDEKGQISAVEFYGTGLDAAYSDARTYWLTFGTTPGLRIAQAKATGLVGKLGSVFYTVERRDRTVYFAALKNGERENFFGSVIAGTPVEQTLTLRNVDQTAKGEATLDVTLQGVTILSHQVQVYFNGALAGTMQFGGQNAASARFALSTWQLREGDNQVRLVALDGPTDISLVDTIRVGYWHQLAADNDALRFTAAGGQGLTINGFSNAAVRVFDVTNPAAVQEVVGTIAKRDAAYSVTFSLATAGQRDLLVITDDKLNKPAAIRQTRASQWRTPAHAADLIILTHSDFTASLSALVKARTAQGLRVEVADVDEIYNEFNFGSKSPQAIRDFLQYASVNWQTPPRYVLIVGDASLDPKNYLGLGDWDLVPTRMIETSYMETASDDWFVDFDGDDIPEMAIGRLPARTAAEAALMVNKIVGYDTSDGASSVMLVADTNNGYDFESASRQLGQLVPGSLHVDQINRGRLDAQAARQQLFDGINRGEKLINYIGHGSANGWNGSLLTADDAAALTNAKHLPVFMMMTCLNGYFMDAGTESLAESLMKAERGGAVAVWASTTMALPGGQTTVNQQLYRQLFQSGNAPVLGDAMRQAKRAVGDTDVRRTWILFGDPTMKLR